MNSNRIKEDGFSNSDTETLFVASALAERPPIKGSPNPRCGYCLWGYFLDPVTSPWILCLNRNSHFRFETVDSLFDCGQYEPGPHAP